MYQDLPFWAYCLVTLVLTQATIASVTIYLHRHQSHRALALHPLVSHFFRFWLWLTTGTVTREWVAIHRKHHAAVETADDPHSPQTRGIGKVLLEGAELYREEAGKAATLEKYGHGTPDDALERYLYSRYSYLGLAFMLAINLLLFGPLGLTIWAIQMIWIPFFAAGVINGLGHYLGYRNFEPADASTNISPFAVFIGGEELHNNHHAFAGSARFSSRWYEFDVGWLYIRILQRLGLAKVKKLPPVLDFDTQKQAVDIDTLRAVFTNRLHIMSDYARQVVRQVYREEKARAPQTSVGVFRQGRRWLTRHDRLLDKQSRKKLERLLAKSHALQEVYRFQQRLRALWQEKSGNQESLLLALQEWCHQAEQSGIAALEDFSRGLRACSLASTPTCAAS